MTTALTMITDAYVLSNVLMRGEVPDAEQGSSGLRVLNQMMGQWDRDGIALGWYQVAALADTLPLDFQDEQAVKYNLAVTFAGEEGIEPTPYVSQTARKTFAGLAKAHRLRVESQLDHLPQPSGQYSTRSIETG
jgi:hypothetical protein